MNSQQHAVWVTMSSVVYVFTKIGVISEVTTVSYLEVLLDWCGCFENGAIFNWKLMQVFEDWCDSRSFGFVGNNSCKGVLNTLKFIHIESRQTSEKWVAIL